MGTSSTYTCLNMGRSTSVFLQLSPSVCVSTLVHINRPLHSSDPHWQYITRSGTLPTS